MKTIEITDEVYAKLIELADEMTTQNMRGTRMPHMFQIRDWKKVYNAEMNGETRIWLDRGNGIEIETFEELVDYLQNYDIKFDETELKQMWDEWQNSDWNDVLKYWLFGTVGDDLEEYSYSLEPSYSNCFLTAKAAQEHLDKNNYHYHKNADVYLNHAWRNPEAELVSEFLCNLVGKPMHT